jgi:hypothetical protein
MCAHRWASEYLLRDVWLGRRGAGRGVRQGERSLRRQRVRSADVRWPQPPVQVPLCSLSLHEDKVLCVDWVPGAGHAPRALISGGADCKLRLCDSDVV